VQPVVGRKPDFGRLGKSQLRLAFLCFDFSFTGITITVFFQRLSSSAEK
jgi:hypothetical protein